jgi:hypothetical protein
MKPSAVYSALNWDYSVTLVQQNVETITESQLKTIKKGIRNFSLFLFFLRKKYLYFIFTIMNRNRMLEFNHSLAASVV